MQIVSRLYDTQSTYDKRLEINKFLCAQDEIKYNKEKPDINNKSKVILTQRDSWQPIHKRVNEVISKTYNNIELMRQQQQEDQLRKELEEQEEIERNRIDIRTKDKKINLFQWQHYYNNRFQKHLEQK